MTFTFERRLETFRQFNWPHGAAKTGRVKYHSQPEDFAQAGFYCRPLVGSTDTVACFLCLKSLDGWEPKDSAWQEHKAHSTQCPLVTLHLATSRTRTFEKWTGAQVRGGTRALVEAGFYHFPKTDGDDTCICYQCGLALDGWEEADDPRHEHERRRPKCPHIAINQCLHPTSYDFILDGRADDEAVKDVEDSRRASGAMAVFDAFRERPRLAPETHAAFPAGVLPRPSLVPKFGGTGEQVGSARASAVPPVTPIQSRPPAGRAPTSTVRRTARKITISVPVGKDVMSSMAADVPMVSVDAKTPTKLARLSVVKKRRSSGAGWTESHIDYAAELSRLFPEVDGRDVLDCTVEEFFNRVVAGKLRAFDGYLQECVKEQLQVQLREQ